VRRVVLGFLLFIQEIDVGPPYPCIDVHVVIREDDDIVRKLRSFLFA